MHIHEDRGPFDGRRFSTSWERLSSAPAPALSWLDAAGSTNDVLADRASAGLSGWTVVGADHQTAGRGRLDRAWTVPAGAALTFSLGAPMPASVSGDALGWAPLLAGSAVAAAVADLGIPATVKWPNDVLADGCKLVGILSRIAPAPAGPGALIVGIGINVDQTCGELPREDATSLRLEGAHTAREDLLAAVLSRLVPDLDALLAAASPADFAATSAAAGVRERMATLGEEVRVLLPGDREIIGTAVGLADDGALLVDADGRRTAVSAGDVVHLRRPE